VWRDPSTAEECSFFRCRCADCDGLVFWIINLAVFVVMVSGFRFVPDLQSWNMLITVGAWDKHCWYVRVYILQSQIQVVCI
jgi:uncharacterized YccA/Bax inhibitor family protein